MTPGTQQLNLADIQVEVLEAARFYGPEQAFDGRPERFGTNLDDLINSRDPFEYVNFLGFNDLSDYIAAKRAEEVCLPHDQTLSLNN